MTLADNMAHEGAYPARGLFGGHDSGLNELRVEYPDGTGQHWGSKEIIDQPVGTRIISNAGGGAGYGHPHLRPAAKVLAEVRDGLLSPERALSDYGVALISDGLAVDEDTDRSTPRLTDSRRTHHEHPHRHRRRRHLHRLPRCLPRRQPPYPQDRSVPSDPPQAVLKGLHELADLEGRSVEELVDDIGLIVHGTTVTTNALLTRRGPKTAMLVTEGFRDVLPMRHGTREDGYDNLLAMPEPLAPRHLRVPIEGRMDYRGTEVTALDEDAVRAAAEVLRDQAWRRWPSRSCTPTPTPATSSELPNCWESCSGRLPDPVRRVAGAGPVLRALQRRRAELLRRAHHLPLSHHPHRPARGGRFDGLLLMMQSNGGVATPAEAVRRAALSLLSGPASGPTAGLARQLAEHGSPGSCFTVDMGGTSFDAALVKGGEPLVMTDGSVDRWRLALTAVDIHTIGAGGGSIASVDEGGLSHVGPQSAGAVPGPACYGRGGMHADRPMRTSSWGTSTQASSRRPDAARRDGCRGRARPLARALELSVPEAAAGVYEMVSVSMATGVREVTVRRGLDPRDFPLVVAGGAGPVHAARHRGRARHPASSITPRDSSIFCADGMLSLDFKHDYVQRQQP